MYALVCSIEIGCLGIEFLNTVTHSWHIVYFSEMELKLSAKVLSHFLFISHFIVVHAYILTNFLTGANDEESYPQHTVTLVASLYSEFQLARQFTNSHQQRET